MDKLISVHFNAEHTHFLCGTAAGFAVYSCSPFAELMRREIYGGIRIVEMLHRSNIFALVGTGLSSQYKTTDVNIWDDLQQKCIAQLSFTSDVRAVRLSRERIVVVLQRKVYMYNFDDLSLLEQIDTTDNMEGVYELSVKKPHVLACPALEVGAIIVSQYDLHDLKSIKAHQNGIQRLALSRDGSQVATTSTVGTLIRVFNTHTGQKTHEFRRGKDSATIWSLSFDPISRYLSVNSDKATVHIFSLNESTDNTRSSLHAVSNLLPSYFSSEWSPVNFKVKENVVCYCAFLDTNVEGSINVMVLFKDFTFNIYKSIPQRGIMGKLEHHNMYLSKNNLNQTPL